MGFFVYQFNFSFLADIYYKEGPATFDDERMLFFFFYRPSMRNHITTVLIWPNKDLEGDRFAWSSIPFSFRSSVVSALANGGLSY
jgi:hypothetical protein